MFTFNGSNNTNKLSPQEHKKGSFEDEDVQIIQINLVLKNTSLAGLPEVEVQIIQINLVLKNRIAHLEGHIRSNNTNKLSPQEP